MDIYDFNPFLRNGTFIKREKITNLVSCKQGKNHKWHNVRFALTNFKCNKNYLNLIKCKNFKEFKFQNIEFELIGKF